MKQFCICKCLIVSVVISTYSESLHLLKSVLIWKSSQRRYKILVFLTGSWKSCSTWAYKYISVLFVCLQIKSNEQNNFAVESQPQFKKVRWFGFGSTKGKTNMNITGLSCLIEFFTTSLVINSTFLNKTFIIHIICLTLHCIVAEHIGSSIKTIHYNRGHISCVPTVHSLSRLNGCG